MSYKKLGEIVQLKKQLNGLEKAKAKLVQEQKYVAATLIRDKANLIRNQIKKED